MTHDEMLSILDAGVTNLPEDFQRYRGALRVVVELHKPSDGQCYECHYEGRDYPCHTIQAIEKELG